MKHKEEERFIIFLVLNTYDCKTQGKTTPSKILILIV